MDDDKLLSFDGRTIRAAWIEETESKFKGK